MGHEYSPVLRQNITQMKSWNKNRIDSPKCPQNNASFQFVISGTHLYNINTAGMRRKSKIPTHRTNNLQGVIPKSGMLKSSHGNQAPM